MSTVLIVVIIVVAVILLAGLVLGMTRGRRVAERRRQERLLEQRREEAVSEHREAAQARTGAAEEAEHRARVAGAVAERERAEARLHEERARAHEMGLNDDELMREDGTTTTGRSELATEREERVGNGTGAADEAVVARDQSVAPPAEAQNDRALNGDR